MNPRRRATGRRARRASSSLPAKSGPKTSGPRIAPETAPKRTKEIAAGAALGREHLGRGGAREQDRPAARRRRARSPTKTSGRESSRAAERGDAGTRAMPEARSRRGSPASARRGPSRARPARGERARDEEDRRPEAEDPLDPGDEHERDRGERDRELDHPGEADELGREQRPRSGGSGTVSTARRPASASSGVEAAAERRPRRRGTGWRTYGAAERACATRPTGDDAAAARELGAERRAASTPRGSARRFERSVPGCVGTTFQSRTSSAMPSSSSTRWTIVAVASAGPVPVSCRSEVNGMPETRVPR